MREPLKVGDKAVVVWGKFGENSPNLGKIVTIEEMREDNPNFGRMWRCGGEDLKFHNECKVLVSAPYAIFPAIWLRKIYPPEQLNNSTKTIEKERIE
jgi:hypothetical protein